MKIENRGMNMMINNYEQITWVCPRIILKKEDDNEYKKRCNHIWSIQIIDGNPNFSGSPLNRDAGHCYCGQKLMDDNVSNFYVKKRQISGKYNYFTIYQEYYNFQKNEWGVKYWDY